MNSQCLFTVEFISHSQTFPLALNSTLICCSKNFSIGSKRQKMSTSEIYTQGKQ